MTKTMMLEPLFKSYCNYLYGQNYGKVKIFNAPLVAKLI